MRPDLGSFANDRQIEMDDRPGSLSYQCSGMSEEPCRGCTLPLRIAGRKMMSDIARTDGSEDGIGQRVQRDIRIGMARTRAGITEVRVGRGTPWAAPMLSMLPQAILSEMLMCGEMLPAERLHALGFLNYLEPDADGVRQRAIILAEQICSNAPLSVLAAKHCMRVAAALGADEGFKASKEFHRTVYGSEDAQEGPRAFAEKRAPVWKGR